MLTAVVLSFLIIPPTSADEDVNCYSNAVFSYRDERSISNMIWKAQDIVGSKRFRTGPYAKAKGLSQGQVEGMFGATGQLRCGGELNGSANLVGKGDVLVFAAHQLWDMKTCERTTDAKNYAFVTVIDGIDTAFEIDKELASGVACPNKQPSAEDDWVLVKLRKSVPDKIKPYGIGDANQMKKGDDILGVNGANADMGERNSENKVRMAKTLEACKWLDHGMGLRATNCSGAPGASGSAILNRNHQMVGILSGGTETAEELKAALTLAKKSGVPFKAQSCNYDQFTCAQRYVQVEGAFKQALESAVNGQG